MPERCTFIFTTSITASKILELMSVGFGFSVGDFLAGLELVGTVIDALRETGNSSSAFRSLINELYALESALLRVKRLDLDDRLYAQQLALRQAASQCQRTIDTFYNKVQKYQRHLTSGGTGSVVKDNWAKIKWAVCRKDDIETFRGEIKGHTSSIEILLLTVQMEATTMDAIKQDQAHKSLAGRIESFSCSILTKLNAITNTVTQGVQQGKTLLEASMQVIQINLRVFQMIHDIQLFITHIPGQIQRQQPVYFIDPFNIHRPFFLEFITSREALLAVLKVTFKELDCDVRKLERSEFTINDTGTQQRIDMLQPWQRCLHPGQKVAMSMIFNQVTTVNSSCPVCDMEPEGPPNRLIECNSCGTIFSCVPQATPNAPSSSINGSSAELIEPFNLAKRKRVFDELEEDEETEMRKFRRIQVFTRKRNQETAEVSTISNFAIPQYNPPLKSILRKPTEKFSESPNPFREGVAPLSERLDRDLGYGGKKIPKDAKWTKIDRQLVNPQALEEKGERFEEREGFVIVLRVLTHDYIQALADRTAEIREEREKRYNDEQEDKE